MFPRYWKWSSRMEFGGPPSQPAGEAFAQRPVVGSSPPVEPAVDQSRNHLVDELADRRRADGGEHEVEPADVASVNH